MVEEVKKLTAQGQRVMFAAPNTGEMERLADIFTEYQVPFRLGTRTPVPGSETYLDETAYFSGDLLTTTIVRATVPEGVALSDARLVIFGARDLFDDSEIEPAAAVAPQVKDRGVHVRLPRSCGGRLCCPRGARNCACTRG